MNTPGLTPIRRVPVGLEIRDARIGDADEIGQLLAAGLGDKYGPAYGRYAVEAISAIARAATEQQGAGRYLVASCDGACAGVAFLGTDGHGTAVMRPLVSALGPLRAARAAIVLSAFAKGRPAQGEATLDELAVSDRYRRRGIGRALIEECARLGRIAGCRRLGLWVTGDNESAQALYRAMGFHVAQRRSWPTGRLLFGAKGALRMELDLQQEPLGGSEHGTRRPPQE
jgi:ribosomal protein S18 acetylase RimI-like enzyme